MTYLSYFILSLHETIKHLIKNFLFRTYLLQRKLLEIEGREK